MRRLLARLPEPMRRTLTWDQGREMTRWPTIEQAGTPVYFCDPHAPWQRPPTSRTTA